MLLPAVDACRPREAVKAVRVMRPMMRPVSVKEVEKAADTARKRNCLSRTAGRYTVGRAYLVCTVSEPRVSPAICGPLFLKKKRNILVN